MADPADNREELLAALRLNMVPGVGPRIRESLLEAFGTPQAVFAARGEQLRQVPGVGTKLALAILEQRETDSPHRELARCRDAGIRLVAVLDDVYPVALEKICDPPGILYCRGTLEPRDELAVAIVGSRRCTLYGRDQAERLARELALAGVTVVSGLARGIDAAAHRGALSAENGRTIAVVANGLAAVYPPEHAALAGEVAARGAVLSEVPLDQPPRAGLFPQRNRIISGLSAGVVIVEASRTSGALHTARHAMEQGREVFAVPGRIDSLASEGCHDLIRDGATLIRNVDDVLEALGPLVEPVRRSENEQVFSPRELTLNDQERLVLNRIDSEPMHVDQVAAGLELETSRVLSTLTVLEMKRMIRRLPGGYVVRAMR
ncbi:MAG: DNA-processing protein DprA [Planctomycetes bacterium]|nr:DNA-processing protein DprA [Planctomycetota bacterium]